MKQRALVVAAFLVAMHVSIVSGGGGSSRCTEGTFPEIFPATFDKSAGNGLHASWCGCFGYAVDVVRGSVGTLVATGGDYRAATERCLFDTLSGVHEFQDLEMPSQGDGYWYLLRADQDGGCPEGGPGTYNSRAGRQVGDRNVEINTSGHDCTCYLTNPGECVARDP